MSTADNLSAEIDEAIRENGKLAAEMRRLITDLMPGEPGDHPACGVTSAEVREEIKRSYGGHA